MKIKNPKTEDQSFVKEVVKLLVSSVVILTAAWTGLLAAIMTVGSVVKFREDRFNKKHHFEKI